MLHAVLFPSTFFDKHNVDDDFQREYNAAVACGLYEKIIIFSYEDWFHNGSLVLTVVPNTKIRAVYRGWMMLPELYAAFYNALAEKNIVLVTSPQEYELFHIFPHIYETIRQDTPKIMLFPQGTPLNFAAIKKAFPRFMVKDYVKSVKGTNFPSFFDKNITQDEFDHWMNIFYDYRGSLFTGGVCIKEFVNLKKYGEHTNEYRVFYINGEIATVKQNSGQAAYVPPVPIALVQKYRGLASKFYTIDFAELDRGNWIIIEAGDGSVSGLSDFQDYCEFFRKLYYCFT